VLEQTIEKVSVQDDKTRKLFAPNWQKEVDWSPVAD
jgi:hypothetical protein